ncbi:MAG: DUF72 domain-containing protein [Acidobacteria bacterium]|nr:DUF72 domain-containing protein [Acidobacteriota bacterium]MBV9475420.1 DUF72 domain-containing protein [Acidobacteriota bacterium]
MSAPLIATQGWNYAAWVGPFYPPGTRAAEFLTTYARMFRGVEVDSSFYAIPDARAVRAWRERTPDGFTFALKMPKDVTHELRLKNADALVREFLDRACELETKLGPILLQMGPDFAPDELPALEAFLRALPRELRFAVEVRQSRWMRSDVLPHLLDVLGTHGVALALSDGRWIRRETMLELAERPTADFLYIRWMGPDREITDYSRIQFDRSEEIRAWAEVLKRVANTKEIYGFFNNHFAGHSPANAREMQRLLGQQPVDPESLRGQRSLF